MAVTGGKLDSRRDIYRGQLFLFLDDLPVAFAKTATLEVTTEEVDITNKMMGDWSGSLPGRKSYTISSESLITRKELGEAGEATGADKLEMSFDRLLKAQIDGRTLSFKMGKAKAEDKDNFGGTFKLDTTEINYTGEVMITSLSVTSESGNIATLSASFKGIGGLSQVDATPAA